MYIKVKTKADACELARRICPEMLDLRVMEEESKKAGYPIYKSRVPGSGAYICDRNDRLELNYDDGHTDNIWIEDWMPQKPEAADVTVGMYKDRVVFGEVKVRDVEEINYCYACGLVAKTLDDGRPGIEITLADGEVASLGVENVAYVRFD